MGNHRLFEFSTIQEDVLTFLANTFLETPTHKNVKCCKKNYLETQKRLWLLFMLSSTKSPPPFDTYSILSLLRLSLYLVSVREAVPCNDFLLNYCYVFSFAKKKK